MSLISRLTARVFKMPPAETHAIGIERDLKVPMPDGVMLLADRYAPRNSGKLPTILIRSPYGRRHLFGLMYGQLFAERGFQVLIQSCRGTFGSGGEFNPMHQERVDGLATLEWIKQQDWFNGQLATNGASYLGYVQWAIADQAGPELQAIAAQVTAPDFRRVTYPGEALALDNTISWSTMVSTQEQAPLGVMANMFAGNRKFAPVFKHLPLRDADTMLIGKQIHFWQDWLKHNEAGDKWWDTQSHWATVSDVRAPAHLLGGWYDIFLTDTIGLYQCLRSAGQNPYLVIGPWTHTALGGMAAGARESLAWFRAHLLGERSGLREKPVRIHVMGANEWRDYPEWPPSGYQPQRWHLQPDRGLAPEPPRNSEPDRYRYDPNDPTPAVGGVILGANSGSKDQRKLEARADVLTYTSAPLDQDVEVIGAVQSEFFVKSSLEHTDFFSSLCDVDPSGKSINVCDGLLRLQPGHPVPESDGCLRVCIEHWPTAFRFKRGHRIRIQVSSGAHPRWARNSGSGEPLATATTLIVADQCVYHDAAHPSAIVLPVKS